CAIVLVVFALISAIRISKLMEVAEKAKEKETGLFEAKAIAESRWSEDRTGVPVRQDEVKTRDARHVVVGLVDTITTRPANPIVEEKKMGKLRFQTEGKLINLVLAYIGAATFCLIFGTL